MVLQLMYARFMFLSHCISSNPDGYKKREVLTQRLTVISGEIPNAIKFLIYILFGSADFSYSTLFLGSTGNWQVQNAHFFF